MAARNTVEFFLRMNLGDFLSNIRRAESGYVGTMRGISAATDSHAQKISRSLADIKGFRELTDQIKATQSRWKAAKQEADRLGASLRAAMQMGGSQEARQFQRQLQRDYDASRRKSAALRQEIEQQKVALSSLGNKLAAAGIQTDRLGEHQRRLQGDLTRATRSARQQAKTTEAFARLGIRPIRDVQREIRRLELAYQRLARTGRLSEADLHRAHQAMRANVAGLRGELSGTSQQLQNLQGNLLAVVGMFAGFSLTIRDALEASMAMDRVESSLLAATGSVEDAGRELSFVTSEANRLGLRLDIAAKSFGHVAAAAKGTKLEGQGARDIFTSVSEAAAVLGLSADDTQGALRALTQVLSKGKVQAEELRGQIGERIPGAFQIAARAMGMSTAELDKMLAAGKIMADDFLPKFAAELRRTYGKALPGAISNTQAEINRLHNALFEFRDQIGDDLAPTVSVLAKALTSTLEVYKELSPATKAYLGVMLGAGAAFAVWNLGLKQLTSALWSFINAQLAATRSTRTLNLALKGVGLVGIALAAYEVGSALSRMGENASKTAESLGKTRQEIQKKIDRLEKLEKRLRENEKGTKAHRLAQEELAKIIPDVNVEIGKQGRILARTGDELEATIKTLNKYKQSLRTEAQTTLALQFDAAVRAFRKADKALGEFRKNLIDLYGIGQDNTTAFQDFVTWFGRLTGTWDMDIQKSEKLRESWGKSKKALEDMAMKASKAGLTVGELGEALKKAQIPKDAQKEILQAFEEAIKYSDAAREAIENDIEEITKKKAEAAGELTRLETELAEEQRRQTRKTLKEKISAAEKSIEAIKRQVDESLRLERQLTDRIKALELEKRNARMTTADKIRALLERGMSDAHKEASRHRSAYETLTKARELLTRKNLSKDDLEFAEQLARKARDMYAELKNTRVALQGVGESGKTMEMALEKQSQSTQKAFQEQNKKTKTLRQSLVEARNGVKKLGDALASIPTKTTKTVQLQAKVEQARKNLAALQKQLAELKDKTVTIKTRHVQARAGGGEVWPARHPGHGLFRGAGTPTSDSNLVAISDWEYVINAARTQLAKPVLDFINFGPEGDVRTLLSRFANVPKFAAGGLVANMPVPNITPIAMPAGGSTPASPSPLQINIRVNDRPVAAPLDPESQIRGLVDDLKRRSRGRLT